MMKQRTKVMVDEGSLKTRLRYGDDDAGPEDILLKPRAVEHCVEAQVQDGDTLQAIALRFHCQISELKRINQIHKDNEIFARRTIKIPVTPYSILTQVLPSEPQPIASSTPNDGPTKAESDHVIDYNAAILNSTIAPSVVPYADNESLDLHSENSLLIPQPARECVETVVVKELTSQGADWGIKWYHLLACVLVLVVIIPLVYVMFYLEKPSHEHAMHDFEHGDLHTVRVSHLPV